MAKKQASKPPQTPFFDRLAMRIQRWRRPTRIALSSFLALVLVTVVSFFVDRLLLQQVYDEELSVWVPTLIIAGVGVGAYWLGWRLLVGFDWYEERPWQASRASALYVVVGLVGVALIVLGILSGLASGFLF
jgi:hypothetical protein